MIVMHKNKYNPKIDFLICKQLLCFVDVCSDELAFRNCFYNKACPKCKHEYEIVKLRKFFEKHDVCTMSNKDVRTLYAMLTGRKEDKSFGIYCKVESLDDVIMLVNLINQTSLEDKHTLFRVLLLKGFCTACGEPIIPYRWICKNLYEAIEKEDLYTAQWLWSRLCEKTKKISKKHDLEENGFALNVISREKNDFIKNVGANNLYVYGSLAVGEGTEYSDIDLLAVFPNDKNLGEARERCAEYWRGKINIPFDIMAMTENELANMLRPAIKSTLRAIGG